MPQDPTKKETSWLRPNGKKNKISSGLYLVSTPIGNLSDISLRALDILSRADFVACEDTRVTKKLLSYYGLNKALLSYNDHVTQAQRETILNKIKEGHVVALVSDAGTPLVSDPGYKLVREALSLDLAVTPLPGANAILPALQLSGLPSNQFCFIGFLPPKKMAREKRLEEWRTVQAPLIAFETAPRLIGALESIKTILGERDVAVVREVTKMFEETRRDKVSKLLEFYHEQGRPKGEIVLLIGASEQKFDEQDVKELLSEALSSMSTKDAAAQVSSHTGLSKKELYDLALKISHDRK